jgi:N-acetylmuramoyl-L-alanine amidase
VKIRRKNSMTKVYISPSTQEHNIGAGNYGTEEKQMNLIGDVVVQLLQYNKFIVYRNKPTMTLQQAVADSNSKDVDIHFAIHSNAGGNGKARGGEVFYVSEKGKKLAAAVYKYLEPLTPTADRGVKKHEHLYELNKTKAPAALAEVMFHDNEEDALFIMKHIQQLGEVIAHGICDYFNVEFKKPQAKPPEQPKGKGWRVCIGYFEEYDNAKAAVEKAKKLGLDAYLVSYEKK